MSRKANGTGSIRKITTVRNGKEYSYWQARYTAGYDLGTGKQIQKSITGKTQKEVAQKLRKATAELDEGIQQSSSSMTVEEWLNIWIRDYLTSVKPRTKDSYTTTVNVHLIPALGAVRLNKLETNNIQKFYNQLGKGVNGKRPLSAKTIKNTHGVLHEALQQAVELHYIRINPADSCKLPKVVRKEIVPLDSNDIVRFLAACKGHKYEYVYLTTLFTGLREGEILGLTWDCVDFNRKAITVNKQLQKERKGSGQYHLVPTKNSKSRYIAVADYVIDILKKQYERQNIWKKNAGLAWEDTDLVFTNELGHNLSAQTVYLNFKKLVASIGIPDARFHDLRHSYAVACLESGDDIKTLQENLGHHTAAFTLDIYGHVTEKMRKESASNMQRFIESVSSS